MLSGGTIRSEARLSELRLRMADDWDVEDLLEAPFKKGVEKAEQDGDREKQHREDDGRKKHHRRHSHRRSRSRSRSPRKRNRSRDRSNRHSRDSRHRRSRSRSRDRHRRSRSRSRSKDRRQKSRSRSRDRYRGSPFRSKSLKESGGYGRHSNSQEGASSPSRPITLGPPAKRPSPNAEPPSQDRDRRTVMCMQLSAKASPQDLEEFFQKVGQVCDVKMISDRNSRRSKGIAYVEFYDENSVLPALALTGQKLFGVPIIVQPTMAEKNRLAAQAQNLKKAEGPKKLYVGSLHYSINEAILKTIFEPFGVVEKIQIMKDESGLSKGYAFVEFNDSECAERAMTNMNGVELAGRPMKVNNVTERDTTAMEALDGEDIDIGLGMTPAARAQLMAKLSDGHNAGLAVPQVSAVPTASPCFMLSNMFDPSSENDPGWENDIRDDVLEECSQHGAVVHIHVEKLSQGNVYVKCITSQVATAAFNSLNGRFFAGKQIVVQYIPESAYYVKFPAAQGAIAPLK